MTPETIQPTALNRIKSRKHSKRYIGIRQRSEGSYEINFRPVRGGDRITRNIKASSLEEAYLVKVQLMADALRTPTQSLDLSEGIAREAMTFEAILPTLERNMLGDGLAHKTVLGLKKVYGRLFTEFRLKHYPQVTKPSELTLQFFLEYKSYYTVTLNRPKGVRAEIQRVKMIMQRLRRLRYVSIELMRDLGEPKAFPTPRARKKAHAALNATQLKALFARMKAERVDLYGPAYFMKRTGRRVEETTLIERKDIVWDGFSPVSINIRAETTKMDEEAPLKQLDPDLQAHIRYYYQLSLQHKAPYLFLNKQHKKFKQKRITEYLSVTSQEMFGVKITAHWFRHHFFTECMNARLSIVDIQAISGIRDAATLVKFYCHGSSEGQASVLEKTRL